MDLINTTVDELCYFAFVFNVGTTSQTRQILDHIKSDAFKNLVILVNEYPALFYRIVSNIGIYGSDLNATYATCFIDSCRSIIQNLVPDTNMGVCLGTLLAHTTVPPYVCELPSVSSTQAAYEYAKRVFLMEPPSRQMTRNASSAAASVGAKLLETLNWDLAGASLKAQLMFMIVSARKFVSEQWFVKLLTKRSTVFVPPFDISFVKTLLELKPHQFVNQCDIILVQTKVLLSLVKDHYFSADGSGRRSRFDARWFAKSGFYECLEFLYRKDNRDAALAFAAASWDVLTAEQSTLIRKMDGVLALVQDDTKALTRFVGATIRNSGTGAPLYKTISAWISLLGPKASASPSCMHVLDLIYHYAFLHTLPLFSAPKLFHLLGAPQDPVPMAGRHPVVWIALACALDAKTRGGGGSGSSQGVRECLDRLCGVAAAAVRSGGESPAKMAPLWDRFFRVFCEQKDGGAWLSTELRFALREYFGHAVKSTKPPLSEYYGMLANWDRDQRAAVEKKYADEVLPFIQKKKVSPLEEAVVAAAGEDGDESGGGDDDDSVEEANKFLLKSNLKPFLVMDLEKRRELFVMYNFIPAEAEKGAQKKESDMARRFDNDIKSTVRDVMCGDGGSSRLDQIVACTQLPVMKRLFECLETYTTEMGALSELNREYAHATATMYTTNEQERTFKMVCTCKRANVFKAPDSEVAAGPGAESIGPNRSAYNKSMHKFLGSSKAIGYVVALLQLVVAKYLSNAPDKLVNMFFALVPLVIHKNLPPKSPIAADIVGILKDIAARARMDASPELQSLLFGVLMDIGKATAYAAYTPTPHYKSVSDPRAPSATASPQHQPVGTEESTRAIIDLYNPACYLKAGDAAVRPTYVSQIDEIGRSATLGDSERELLYQRFGSTFDDAAFRVVVEDAAVLSEMLGLLRRLTGAEAPLVGLFVGFCSRLIQHDFTRFAPVVADVLISSSDENAGAAQVGLDILRGAFAAVDSARLSLAQVAQVVRVLTHKLPLKPAPRLAVLAIASQLFVSNVWLSDFERRSIEKAGTSTSANASASTGEEMIPSLIDVGVDTSIDTLKLFTSFVKAFLGCCRSARADGPSVEKFAALVKDFAAALIARNSNSNNNMAVVALMNVVYTLVVPKLIAMKMSNSPLIADIFSAFPPAYVTGSWRFWNKATVDYMAAVIFGSNAEAADLYTKLAKDVDWASFLAYVHERAAEEKRKRAEEKEEEKEDDSGSADNRKMVNSSLLLSVFRFFILFRTINPDVFNQELWDTLTPASIARPDAAAPGFDWSVLESSEFAALFGGSFFAELLKECAANMAGAPVGPFEAMLWIAEVAKTLRFDAVVAASREARALAFLAVENAATHTFWLLSSNDADRILLEIELSFCTYLAGFPVGTCDEEFGEVVRNTLSFCAPQNMRILSGTASFAKQVLENSKTHEPSVAEEVQRRTKKYSAIVFQFPKQSSQRIALEFIAQTFSVFGKDVQLSIAFMEEAVRAYLLTASSADTAAAGDGDGENGVDDNDGKTNSLGERMSLPPVPLEAFLQECANSDASLCVYALCERFRYIGKMEKYLNSVAQLISKFSPHKIYQYDVVAVWMAPINALASEGWTPTANELLKLTQIAKFLRDFATDIININGFILGASGYESTFTRLRFIALSCSIFYLKLILKKGEEDDDDDDDDGAKSGYGDDVTTAPLLSKAEEDHVDALNQLVKLKASNDTPDLKAFFKITKKFNDSSYTASSFKRDVTRTLCPMAPYLQNL